MRVRQLVLDHQDGAPSTDGENTLCLLTPSSSSPTSSSTSRDAPAPAGPLRVPYHGHHGQSCLHGKQEQAATASKSNTS